MTHFQEVFIKNLRFYRNKKGLSQLKLSELLNITPNYLNAVENGKNFPSPEVVQRMIDLLEVLPYQLFLECPGGEGGAHVPEKTMLLQELNHLRQYFISEFDKIIRKYDGLA
jgi:transcriptional regulator with XRE-family HTH domain